MVVYLGQNLLDLEYAFYTNSFYSSSRLAQYLLTRDTLLTGTIRANRDIPDMVRDAPLTRHQTAFARKNNILVLKYHDTKDVYLITTQFTANLEERERYVVDGQNCSVSHRLFSSTLFPCEEWTSWISCFIPTTAAESPTLGSRSSVCISCRELS